MIDITSLRNTFNEKLKETDSIDSAFTKAVWVAYKAGIEDGKKENGENETGN